MDKQELNKLFALIYEIKNKLVVLEKSVRENEKEKCYSEQK